MRFVICGAGAIGTTLGGYLSLAGESVTLIARPAHAQAIRRDGLRLKTARGEFRVRPDARETASGMDWTAADWICIASKSQDTRRVLADLASAPPELPVFCFQNAVRNEEWAAERFAQVYGVLVLFSANFIEPGSVEHTRNDALAIGRYPSGIDETLHTADRILTRAGFRVTLASDVMAHKWGKLLVNLNNALYALTDTWLQRAYTEPDYRAFMAETMREGLRVLDRCGIASAMGPGEPSSAEFIEMLAAGKFGYERPQDLPPDRRTYPSTWQDVMLGRRTTEVELFNGEITELGRAHGIPTPYNTVLLESMRELLATGARPGYLTLSEIERRVHERMKTWPNEKPNTAAGR